ncbi:hypothetical protein C9374_006874 [Naegleria lovaniensis]|uniref:Uncharacterized protein n=1 Tax=Naegleria lovaniensis TaxID=51637 RepID=A0AA88H2F4_NAELO|nr:uncharacterized protein C9374_006874 [Naegleria lovaniensis]KAG2393343.1 hypothetical protein C9374_006874 [Naegleria lovaniensis]
MMKSSTTSETGSLPSSNESSDVTTSSFLQFNHHHHHHRMTPSSSPSPIQPQQGETLFCVASPLPTHRTHTGSPNTLLNNEATTTTRNNNTTTGRNNCRIIPSSLLTPLQTDSSSGNISSPAQHLCNNIKTPFSSSSSPLTTSINSSSTVDVLSLPSCSLNNNEGSSFKDHGLNCSSSDWKDIRDILSGDDEFCMLALSPDFISTEQHKKEAILLRKQSERVFRYMISSFFQNRSFKVAMEHMESLINPKKDSSQNSASLDSETSRPEHISTNAFFLFFKFYARALFLQHRIENPDFYLNSDEFMRHSINDLTTAIEVYENGETSQHSSPSTNNNFNLFGLCHQVPCGTSTQPSKTDDSTPTQKRKLSQFLSLDAEEYSPLLETVDCEESKLKRRKFNMAVLSSMSVDKSQKEIKELFHPCLRRFYEQVKDKLSLFRDYMKREKCQERTSMDDAILGTELVCKYRAKESYAHFLESVQKNPYNYHAYFQLLEVFRLMDKNIETMKWLRIGIVRCDEELQNLRALLELSESSLMSMKSYPKGIELISTFETLIKKTEAVREVFFGCLHHFTHNTNPNDHFFSATDKDPQCFYGHYFIGMLTGFNKLVPRNHTAPIHFLDVSLAAIRDSHAFGFRGIIPSTIYPETVDAEMTYGNSMLQPFVYYMIGLLKWRANDVKSTMANFNKALECNENLILIYLNRVTLFQQTKHYDRAFKDNQKLLKIIMKHSPVKEIRSELSMAYLNQGLLLLDMKEKNIDLVVSCLEKSFTICPMNICALDWLCGIQTNRRNMTLEKYEEYAEQVYEYMERLERDDMLRFCKLQVHMYRLFHSDKVSKWSKLLLGFGNSNMRTH